MFTNIVKGIDCFWKSVLQYAGDKLKQDLISLGRNQGTFGNKIKGRKKNQEGKKGTML